MSRYMDPYWIYGSVDDKFEMATLTDLRLGDIIWDDNQWQRIIKCEPMDSQPDVIRVWTEEIKIAGKSKSFVFDIDAYHPPRCFIRKVES